MAILLNFLFNLLGMPPVGGKAAPATDNKQDDQDQDASGTYTLESAADLNKPESSALPNSMKEANVLMPGSPPHKPDLFCRICYDDDVRAPVDSSGRRGKGLISPCHCTGTAAMVHLHCLEKWLTIGRTDTCELCEYTFQIKKAPGTFIQFFNDSSNERKVRQMIADVLSFFIIMLTVGLFIYWCGIGAYHYYGMGEDWEVFLLGLLSVAVFAVFCVWCNFTLTYHRHILKTWSRKHPRVTVCLNQTEASP